MLHFLGFAKSYQTQLVLSIDDLTIPSGAHWIKGENGAGKTSLFKSIAGILPFDGEIALDAVNLKREPITFRRVVNYSEAEPVFPEFLTAKDLVRFIGKTKNATHAQQDHFCHRLGIDGYFTKPCGTYSSGMLKKLSLVLAFLGDPKLIIPDEPLVTLDEVSRNVLMQMIHEKMEDSSMTFLLSSHQMLDSAALHVKNVYSIHNQSIELL